jgi:hypothetical protein
MKKKIELFQKKNLPPTFFTLAASINKNNLWILKMYIASDLRFSFGIYPYKIMTDSERLSI